MGPSLIGGGDVGLTPLGAGGRGGRRLDLLFLLEEKRGRGSPLELEERCRLAPLLELERRRGLVPSWIWRGGGFLPPFGDKRRCRLPFLELEKICELATSRRSRGVVCLAPSRSGRRFVGLASCRSYRGCSGLDPSWSERGDVGLAPSRIWRADVGLTSSKIWRGGMDLAFAWSGRGG